jgi:pyruvate,water dikinase
VEEVLEKHAGALQWPTIREELTHTTDGAESFARGLEDLTDRFLDIAYDHERLHDQTELLLRNLIELSRSPDRPAESDSNAADVVLLEQRLLEAVGAERRDEAIEIIETGRISWKLRDDDNLLIARLESQLLRAIEVAAKRLRDCGRLTAGGPPDGSHVEMLARALRDGSSSPIAIEVSDEPHRAKPSAEASGETPRQLIGQPASPGVGTGRARCIRGRDDLSKFRNGEVMVCDAIQPTMTHLVPLATAIVERRGGMLIHGAIIARELGIPCVNGVRRAADILKDGDLVTVDGHLGIVAVGEPEFDLELHPESDHSSRGKPISSATS